MIAKSKTHKAPPPGTPRSYASLKASGALQHLAPARKTADDPIFALIAERKALAKKRFRLSSKLGPEARRSRNANAGRECR
jgi:hypothetical protein